MNTTTILEFDMIIAQLQEHALSQRAKDTLGQLAPYLDEGLCVRKMKETTAARLMLDACGSPPLASMKGLHEILTLCEAGSMLVPEQLGAVQQFTASCKRVQAYLKRGETVDRTIASYGGSIADLSGLQAEIERCISGDMVSDEASSTLRNIRRKKEHTEVQIKEKLNHILQSRKQYLSDNYIATRSGHYVLPVQRKYQNQFGGTVIEVSGKGSTVFMEPDAISKLQAGLTLLEVEEDGEIRRILYTLSALVVDQTPQIKRNMEAMEILDVLFAKAKLSASMKAGPVEIGGQRRMEIINGRHPLLNPESCVPLNFTIKQGTNGVIITGPNTGGKTVALKTVGLLSHMAQCGLHIPCGVGSYIPMQDAYWCDIGDGQSISQNLSTFSGHMTNVIHILEHASRDSLVLLDELGSGTDPAEGMGIAIAVLEELRHRGCLFLVTTHYPQVKTYAESTPGVESARMAFDRESLRPLYLLEMGKAGESCALHIAQRLGLPAHLLHRAAQEAYGEDSSLEAPTQQRAASSAPKSQLKRAAPVKQNNDPTAKFQMGDSVEILPDRELGIVYRPVDEQGNVVVQVKGQKRKIRHTRLQLKVAAAQLYPPDYDFSILFDSVENRKARHKMGKHHDPTLEIVYEEW